jgi:sn-glycerol 3-phosphate transport system permease protein
MALAIALGKIAISLLSAFAIVYFRFRFRQFFFWAIFVTLMLPVEVRILPTYKVLADLNMLNTYAGLTIPLIASTTATFLFRQFYMTVPNELAEAAQMDGAGPLRFLWSFLLPLSWANIAALFVVLFIYGWNEYFWPLLITNERLMRTTQVGIAQLRDEETLRWGLIMAGVVMVAVPTLALLVLGQRQLIRGLTAGAVKG